MSRYRLSNVFNDQYAYNYTTLPNPDPETECFICKTPYFPNDAEGCQAIQLHPCGHIIGRECFGEWISRAPQSCPYWSHHLPPTLKASASEDSLEVKFLRWVVHTPWITSLNDHHDFLLEVLDHLEWRQHALRAVKALAEGTLTDEDVNLLTKVSLLTFMDPIFRRGIYGTIFLFLVGHHMQLYFELLYKWALLEGLCGGIWKAIVVVWWLGALHAYAYSTITWWVLKLGVRQSSASKRIVLVGMQK
ncbi:hypothetical protein BKA58DRAFT_4251 [Alternaria rosae]|uniref:uncharacterized protein n=1 Tax=Alternaria rosae TaxID=1187941 RepID=UPI001E8DA7B3|nr:uncharacterized protein BKA58DRAFT_4251 [Alternaria rosae]KAH6881538.1 hypothetical protein BKA58DRAFT_4251 [Alternaria rosae]